MSNIHPIFQPILTSIKSYGHTIPVDKTDDEPEPFEEPFADPEPLVHPKDYSPLGG